MRCGVRAAALLLGGAALAACAATTPPSRPAAPAAERQATPRFVAVVGPLEQHEPPFLGVSYSNFYCLRSLLDRRTGDVATQLYVADSYFGAERRWQSAQDGDGEKLPFVLISSAEIDCGEGCAYADEFAAGLPDALLRSSPQGLAVTFGARSGDRLTIRLSGGEIARQQAAVAAVRTRLVSQSGTPQQPQMRVAR